MLANLCLHILRKMEPFPCCSNESVRELRLLLYRRNRISTVSYRVCAARSGEGTYPCGILVLFPLGQTDAAENIMLMSGVHILPVSFRGNSHSCHAYWRSWHHAL
jgi:hypothetical protein